MDHQGKTAGFGFKTIVGAALAAFGLGVTLYAMGISIKPLQKPLAGAAVQQEIKPAPVMNLALGSMVFVARDLGFTVQTAKGERLDPQRLVTRLETQLKTLRELYRQESAVNGKLLGSLTLRFQLSPAGAVSEVKELAGSIADGEFRKAILAAAAKWHLPDLVHELASVQVPLLFVHEGMDITTLVRWESRLDGAAEKAGAQHNRNAAEVATPAKSAAAQSALPAASVKAQPIVEAAATPKAIPTGDLVQIKYVTPLRQEPHVGAPVLTTFTIGTKVQVTARSREWLQVRTQHDGSSGYIRKEFATPVQVAESR